LLFALGIGLSACNSASNSKTNNPPLVNAGADQQVNEQTLVLLSGSAEDPDGHIVSYQWQQVTGPSVVLEQTEQAVSQFTAPAIDSTQTLTFHLSATDNHDTTRNDETRIVIHPVDKQISATTHATNEEITIHIQPLNIAPVVSAGEDQTINAQRLVTLSGSATDPDGDIITYEWQQKAGLPIVLAQADQAIASFQAPATTTQLRLLFRFTVTDDGGTSQGDNILVKINPPNDIASVSAGDDQIVIEQTLVTLAGSINPPSDAILEYAWQQTAGNPVSLSHPTERVTAFTAPATSTPITLAFRLSVTDQTGTTQSDEIIIQVNPMNTMPSVSAGDNQSVDEASKVRLEGLATDDDGTIDNLNWKQISGIPVSLINTDQLQAYFIAPIISTPEHLVFELSATDNLGAINRSEVTIQVTPVIGTGFRYSTYGPAYNPGANYWANIGEQMASKIANAKPQGIWIVGNLVGSGPKLSFPGTSDDPNIQFSNTDENEQTLSLFDQLGLQVWLQVEPGQASVVKLIQLMLDQYSQHPSVIGIGVDVEWYRVDLNPEGKAITDQEAKTWLTTLQAYDKKYRLFLKHWLMEKMPPTVRNSLLFIDDSQQFGSLSQMVNEFKNWGDHFAPAPVAFQFGYQSDANWWSTLNEPPIEIGQQILASVSNTKGLYWVDFTAFQVFPP